jgi:hypothetical protein
VVETSNNFGNEKNVVQNINDRSAQAKALAEARGHVYKDLLLRNFTDTQIIEAFGELSVSDEDVAVPGAVAAPVPAPGVAVPPAAAPPAAAPPAAAPEIESPTAQARRILQEQRPDLNYSVLRAQGYTDQQMIDAFRPGPTVAAAERAGADKLKVDYNALLRTVRRGSAGEEDIARYAAETMAGVTGKTYEDYKSEGLSNNQISELLFDEESVARKANTFLDRVARSTVAVSPMAVGALTSAVAAAPTGPVGMLLAGIIGGMGAEMLVPGQDLSERVFGPDIPVPLDQQFADRAGRFVGETIPFVFYPYVAMARTPLAHLSLLKYRQQQGVSTTPFDSLRLAAAFRPKSLAATEVIATGFGAFAAAKTQERYFQGEPDTIVPDLVGGVSSALAPARAITAFSTKLLDDAFKSIQNVTSKAETRATNTLADVVVQMYIDSGRDPLVTIARLKETPLADLAQTYGVDIGTLSTLIRAGDDPIMRDLFATLQNVSAPLGPTRARAQQTEMLKTFEGLVEISRIMASTGDPELLKSAAILQQEAFSATLQTNYDAHLSRAATLAKNILEDDPLASQKAGIVVADLIDASIVAANRQREKLYNKVDDGTLSPNGFTNFEQAVARLERDLGPVSDLAKFAENLPSLRRQVDQLAEKVAAGEDVTFGDMRRIRGAMLENMRRAGSGANPDPTAQRYWGQLAESVFDDLMFSPDEGFAALDRDSLGRLSENSRRLLEANQFNVAFYDVYGRAFPEEIIREAASGGRRIPPELINDRMRAGSGDATDLRYRQLDDAITLLKRNFPSPETSQAADDNLKTLRGSQDTMLRLIASRTVDLSDPDNPRVNVDALQKLMRADNPNGIAPSLERFPDLKEDLENAITAENLLLGVVEKNAELVKSREGQLYLQRLLQEGDDTAMDVADSIAAAIGSPGARIFSEVRGHEGEKNLINLINIAKGSDNPELALGGLVDTVLDRGITYSSGGAGPMNFSEFRKFMTESLGGKTASTLEVLRREGAITVEQDLNFRTLLREGEIVENALRSSGSDREAAEALQSVSLINLSLIGRFLGAREASRLQRIANVDGLIIPAMGARIGAQIAQRIPASRKMDVFSKFMDDPEFASFILEKGVARRGERLTAVQARNLTNQLNSFQNYLTRSGLIASAPLLTGGDLPEGERASFTQFPTGQGMDTQALQESVATPPASQGMDIQTYLNSLSAPPQVAPSAPPPAAPVQAPPPGPPPSQQGAAAQPGASYAALFPNDTIASILQQREMQQGIGSLAGPR